MNILFETFTELGYEWKDSFCISCTFDKTEYTFEINPFVSSDHPSQVYLSIELPLSVLTHVLESDFLPIIASSFRKQSFHHSYMDKNTTLLLTCEGADDTSEIHSNKVKIEDDPYYFKKYVLITSKLEKQHAIEYLQQRREAEGKNFSCISEIQSYLCSSERFSSYKENHTNQITYSYFIELATKLPCFPFRITPASQILSIDSMLKENLGKESVEIGALERLLSLDLNYKEESVESVLAHWEDCLNNNI